ncbi:MAG: NAD(P)-dependent glycerol-3-phosphate dehydrogenase [Lachnospiraceae bacterium]|nr:NAD(P)-dependent glycerol-3-phosphate dehydrogenase [Lachnospiraceae bacterium]
MSRIGVLGAGSWGMALAKMLAETGNETAVWTHSPEKLDAYRSTRRHPNLDCELPESLIYEKDLGRICTGKDILVTAVPSVHIRTVMHEAAPDIPDGQIIVNVSKGIESSTLMTMTDIIGDEMKRCGKAARTVALSGPTHAEEVVAGLPSTIVSSSADMSAAEYVQDVFMNPSMRVYTNEDLLGIELCGAMKNIIAIAAGICIGIGYGDNSKAALITRGLAEITRLGLAMGCRRETFAGLAGMGDLIVTATSRHSRNNRAGYYIGQGLSAEEARKKVGMVVEGINALPAILALAEKYGIELPICEAVDAIISRGADTKETVNGLMMRGKKNERF